MSQESESIKRRRKCIDVESETDKSENVVRVKFISDSDCKKILFKEGSASWHRSISEGTRTPKHKRVSDLQGKTPPSSRFRSRSSLSIPLAVQEEDEESDDEERGPVLKPKVLFADIDGDSENSPKTAHLLSSRKNKERMDEKVKASREKYSQNTPEGTPSKGSENGFSTPRSMRSTPRSKRSTPQSNGFNTPKSKGTPQSKQNKEETPSKGSDNGFSTPTSKRRTPQSKQNTPRTPSTSANIATSVKTPYSLRGNIKKNLKAIMNDDGSDESDFSMGSDTEKSDSEFSASDTSEPVTPTRNRAKTASHNVAPQKQAISTPTNSLRTRSKSYKSDDYFVSHGSSKVVTSDKTLSLLQNPRLNTADLQAHLKFVNLKHLKEIRAILNSYSERFENWLCLLLEGFNLLLHGVGSKTTIVNSFFGKMLSDKFDVIIVNGFFITLTIKEILKSIVDDVISMANAPGEEAELCDAIISYYSEPSVDPLFILLNNLDGAMLQSSRAQNILARLASCNNIHLVATIDHVNAPLLFDQAQLSRFNFIWQNVTNFMAYPEETSFENSLLVQQSGGLALSSLRSVFQSLNENAKEIFKLIMERHLSSKDPKYPGISFTELFRECRDMYWVSSETSMKTQLTEFLDHQLLKSKRGYDGSEMLSIPIPRATLIEFQSSQEE